jgi:hypothetical protein
LRQAKDGLPVEIPAGNVDESFISEPSGRRAVASMSRQR